MEVSFYNDKTDVWIDLLEQNQMKNATHYSKALCMSQRVRLKIERLKALKRKSQVHPESISSPTTSTTSFIDNHKPTLSYSTDSNNTVASEDSDIATPCSPTPCEDKLGNNSNELLYISSKAIPIVNKTQNIPTGPPPRCPLPALPSSFSDENQRLDSAVDLATLHEKSLPNLPPSKKKKIKPLPLKPPPLPPKISTINSYNQQQQPNSAASKDAAYGVPILHVEKKKLGLKGFITRTYRLDSIIVTRTVFPNGLLMARDCYTGRRMAVLHIMVTSIEEGFTFIWCTSKSIRDQQKNSELSYLIPDDRLQTALYSWVKCQNLPNLSLASQVFRRGLKLYVVYDTVLFQNTP